MTNKTLAISIIIVILAFAGVVLGYRAYVNSNPPDYSVSPQAVQNPPVAEQPPLQTPPPAPPASSTPAVPPASPDKACTPDFDANKLKTAKVTIANRQAEIMVQGFGKIQVAFYEKDAPKAVENFLRLANSGYYDCLTFHRVAKGFVIQGGDPTGTGSGGDSAFGGPFADELNPDAPSYKTGYVKGVLAMANSGPNTNSSQFFIMLGDNTTLPHAYTIFGKVVLGQSVVDKIGQVDITPGMGPTDGKPVTPVVMQSVKIIK